MSGWLIDGHGEFWPDDSAHLRALYRCRQDAATFARFAVENLGFVLIRRTANGLFVSWRPTATKPLSFVSVHRWLSEQPEARTVVATFSANWSYRFLPTRSEAVPHLLHVFSTTTCTGEGYFKSERLRPEHMPASSKLPAVLNALNSVADEYDSPVQLWHVLSGAARN